LLTKSVRIEWRHEGTAKAFAAQLLASSACPITGKPETAVAPAATVAASSLLDLTPADPIFAAIDAHQSNSRMVRTR